ncbi:protein phosphatase inhibitor 2 [Lactuca sativa]|uniref:protein phosphatase inhibitor 2 n=1 Tax=Lactuca sativa TaxID=4236 RepID=UPI0022B07968|nr:protein phosphatase inhibitor 2 [Lactuca sativa]
MSCRRGFRWDEANLGEIEANKHVRHKITEPKAPYHPMIHDTDGSLSPIGGSDSFLEGDDNNNIRLNVDAIRSALNEMASSSSNSNSHSGWTSSDDEDEADVMYHDLDDEGGKSARSFREKRKAHYDEYRKVKELQKKESMKKDDEKKSIVDGLSDELILYIRMQFTYEIREGRRKRVLSATGSLDVAGDYDLDCDEDTNSSVFPLRVVTRGIYSILLPVGGELRCLQGILGPCASLEKKGALCSDTSIGQGGSITWKG